MNKHRQQNQFEYDYPLKRSQKGRHLRVGAFIFGASEENQKKQKSSIRALLKGSDSDVKYFVEKDTHQKRDVEDREELQRASRYCRTANATFLVSTLKGLFETQWQALSWMKHQVEMYDTHFLVADDPNISKGTLHVLSAQADEMRRRIGAESKKALDEIRQKLKEGERVVGINAPHEGFSDTQSKGNQKQAELARKRDEELMPEIEALQNLGMSYAAIARQFNMLDIPTPSRLRGQKEVGEWHASTVRNIVLRNRGKTNE